MKELFQSLYYFLILFLLLSCKNESSENTSPKSSEIQSKTEKSDTLAVKKKKVREKSAVEFVREVAGNIENENFKSWADYTKEKVYFSPYAHVDTSEIQSLKTSEFKRLHDSGEKVKWGTFDGTGEPIQMDLESYFNRFVSDFNLTDDKNIFLEDTIPNRGNELNNVSKVFPKATVVEIHKPASEESMGMDWRSLMFVLEKENGEWKLKALVHNEWTI